MPTSSGPAGRSRYARQERFAPLGAGGQRAIRSSRVLLVGIGALGTRVASTLVRAGVGEIWLVDRDVVELDNLQRQVLFCEEDAREQVPKAVAAATRLRQVNRDCVLHELAEDFGPETFAGLGAAPEVIIDGTDNFATRLLLNDLALRDGIPWIYGGAVGATGTAMVVLPGETACLRCLVPRPPPTGEIASCETTGVLAPAVSMVAAFQSAQALKLLSGRRAEVARGIFSVDVWRDRYHLGLRGARPQPDCPACAFGRYPALENPASDSLLLCGREVVQVRGRVSITLERLAANLTGVVEDLELTPHLLRFFADDCRFSVFRGGRALLFGVHDLRRARVLYDRYVGG